MATASKLTRWRPDPFRTRAVCRDSSTKVQTWWQIAGADGLSHAPIFRPAVMSIEAGSGRYRPSREQGDSRRLACPTSCPARRFAVERLAPLSVLGIAFSALIGLECCEASGACDRGAYRSAAWLSRSSRKAALRASPAKTSRRRSTLSPCWNKPSKRWAQDPGAGSCPSCRHRFSHCCSGLRLYLAKH